MDLHPSSNFSFLLLFGPQADALIGEKLLTGKSDMIRISNFVFRISQKFHPDKHAGRVIYRGLRGRQERYDA
jgi:hypothetical protein